MVYHYAIEITERRVFFDRIQVIVNFNPVSIASNLQVIQRVYETYTLDGKTSQQRFEEMFSLAMADLQKLEDTIAIANEIAFIAISQNVPVANGVVLMVAAPPEVPPAEGE